MPMKRSVAAVLAVLTGLSLIALTGALATAAPPVQSSVVGSVPPQTPAVDDGSVLSITTVGNTVVAGGTFTRAASRGGTMVPRNSVFAFNADTGQLSSSFVPALNGRVESVVPGPQPNTVYVGGQFTTVNGAPASHVALLNVSTGQQVAGFRAASTNGVVNDLVLSGNRLYVGGNFTTAGGTSHAGFAALNPATGAVDPFVNLQVSGHHNDSGTGAQGAVGVRGLDVTSDGGRMVAIGNFKRVDGLLRDQVVAVDLGGASAQVAPNWNTSRYSPYCFNWAFDTYVRGIDIAPDDSYFVITSTGGHNTGTLCDTAARFETFATGTDVQPTWVDYTGGDTLWSVETTGEAVYVGGHQRWMNNPFASDRAGAGAVPRPGIAALDPETGLPLRWNPGRNPRGAAAFALHATGNGLWVGSDTEWIGNFQYRRPRLAFFPLAGGAPVAEPRTPTLPGTAYVGKATPNALSAIPLGLGGAGTGQAADSGGITWDNVRGTFMLGDTLYYGRSDGFLYKRAFDGTAFGPELRIDPYNDPAWAGVSTGSNSTYDGRLNNFYAELSSVTGMFYADGRIYYTLSGQSSLFYRTFSADSDIVGPDRFTSPTGRNWSGTGGLFYANDTVYVVSAATGTLSSVPFNGGVPSGAPTVVDNPAAGGNDWRGRAPFLSSAEPANTPPTAAFDQNCTDLTCAFDAGASGDTDGTIASYAWDFGDGETGSGANPSHTYAAAGTYQVSLEVTDDEGATDVVTANVAVEADDPAGAVDFVAGDSFAGNTASPRVTVPASVQPGDQMVLFGSFGVLAPGVTGPAGWTSVGTQDSSSMTTRVWTRTATAADAGSNVSPGLGSTTKTTLSLAAYSGVDTADPFVATGSRAYGSSSQHTTPQITGTEPSWLLSYWADKSSATTAWTAPAGVAVREDAYTTNTGRVTSMLADSAGPRPAGTLGGLTATTDQTSSRAAAWSLALRADAGDPPPDPAGDVPAFVAGTSTEGTATGTTLPVPSNVQPGDRLVLALAHPNTVGAASAPPGWTLVGSHDNGALVTRVWSRPVQAGDAGNVAVSWASAGKYAAVLAGYRGAHPTTPFGGSATADTVSASTHSSPVVPMDAGSLGLTVWTDKSSSTTQWQVPAAVSARQAGYGVGGGRFSVMLADSRAAVAAGPYGGHAATTDGTSGRGSAWTLELRPEP
jgi:PKD repeat protein